MMFYEPVAGVKLSRGEVLLNGGYPEDAMPFLQAECERNPANPATWVNIGSCQKYLGNYVAAEMCMKRAIDLAPGLYQAHHNLALVYGEMGRFREEMDEWLKAAPYSQSPDTHFGLATAMLRQKKFSLCAEIWENARLRKNSAAFVPNIRVWRGENLGNRKIFITREGGMGDIFWLLRYLKPLKDMGAYTAFMVYKSMKTLLEGHPWIDRAMDSDDQADPQEFDYQVPLWSIMMELFKLGTPIPLEVKTPYINVRKLGVPREKHTFKVLNGPVVGVCWTTGELTSVHRKMRVIQDEYLPILAQVPVNWVSLVPGEMPSWCKAVCPMGWKETAEFMAGLDLIISVDTSVSHLAGAMNIPTWLCLPINSAWFYFDDVQRCSWYPSVRIFRNPEPVSFRPVVEEMARELTRWVEARQGVGVSA